ncbi:MAG: type II secretion system protein [Planctomycetota bacterium]
MNGAFFLTKHPVGGPSPPLVCRQRAFTLIEVMVAIVILSIAALAFISAHLASVNLQGASRETALALNEARRAIEDIRSRPYAEITQANVPATFDVAQGSSSLTPAQGASHCGSITVSPENANGMKEILVTVRWRSISGNERHIELACQVCDHL